MLNVKIICVGGLKDTYLKDAVKEYEKRLSAYCKLTTVELKDDTGLLPALSDKSYKIALCVEGKQLSSEELSTTLARVMQECGELALVIGSSHGLSPRVKAAANLKLSVSALTFPHQLMRVLLLETTYRSLSILHGSKYHK